MKILTSYKNILLAAFILSAVGYAQEFKKNATAGFTFLQIPASARTAALGESSLALSDVNSDAVFINPGSLGFTARSHSLSVSYAPWLAEIKNYAMSYAVNTPAGVWGVGVVMLDYGEMPRTTIASGQKVYDVNGTFKANALAAGLTYSKMLTDKFSFGATLKYVRETIDIYKADNILFDGGILYYTGLGSLRIAASINNFGTDAKFINDQFKMPSMLKLGAAAELLNSEHGGFRVTLLTEAVHPSNADERLNTGAEIAWKEIVVLRGGYKFFADEESYSFGVGVSPGVTVPVNIDFSYSDYGRLGKISRFTLQLGL